MLVSATLPQEVLEMTNKFMTDPIRVLVKRDELTLEVRGRGQLHRLRKHAHLLEMHGDDA